MYCSRYSCCYNKVKIKLLEIPYDSSHVAYHPEFSEYFCPNCQIRTGRWTRKQLGKDEFEWPEGQVPVSEVKLYFCDEEKATNYAIFINGRQIYTSNNSRTSIFSTKSGATNSLNMHLKNKGYPNPSIITKYWKQQGILEIKEIHA